jgi:hypothetical protein
MIDTPTPFDAARSLIMQGRIVEAEALVVRKLDAVTAQHGAGTPHWASAQCDLGNVLINAARPARGPAAAPARRGARPGRRTDGSELSALKPPGSLGGPKGTDKGWVIPTI